MSRLVCAPESVAPPPPANRIDAAISKGVVPVDKYGMPYLLHPGSMCVHDGQFWDDDHSFFFSGAPELTEDDAGEALRISRVQHVPRRIHRLKHEVFFKNGVEELPVNRADKFALTVLACAGYTPRSVLDLRGSSPELVRISERMHKFIRGQAQLHPERRQNPTYGYYDTERSTRKIGLFFAEYVKEQKIDEIVKDNIIDEFLNTEDEDMRRQRGNFIIRQAIVAATDSVEPKYQKALRKQFVRPRIKSAKGVVATVFPVQVWTDYHDSIAAKLAA